MTRLVSAIVDIQQCTPFKKKQQQQNKFFYAHRKTDLQPARKVLSTAVSFQVSGIKFSQNMPAKLKIYTLLKIAV